MKRTSITAAIALASLALSACGGSQGDPWIAEVDGATIRRSELMAEVDPRWNDEPNTPRREILLDELERLVDERVVLNRAEELELSVPDPEVEARLESLFGEQAFMADEEYRETVRRQILLDRVALVELAGRIRVGESAIVLYFEENRDRFGSPERAQVRQIVVQERALARRLLGELRSGADFGELAREWSIGPEAAEGGLLPPFARGELPEAFDGVFRLRTGKLSDVIESPYGFHVFRLERKIPASEPVLDAAREQIRAELQGSRLEELRRPWLRELRAGATIRVNEPLLGTLE
jgi:parvulin-like peptidyl-prolyl isomerase